jgi:hypothetical protein
MVEAEVALVKLILLEPKLIDRTPVPLLVMRSKDASKPFNAKFPLVRARALVAVIGPRREVTPPVPTIVNCRIVFPAVLIVPPAVVRLICKIGPTELLKVIPELKVKLPEIIKKGPEVPVIVPVNPVKSKFRQLRDPETVTVAAPEAAVKKTLSAAVGTD